MRDIAVVRKRSRVWPIVLTIVVVALIAAGVYYYMNGGRIPAV